MVSWLGSFPFGTTGLLLIIAVFAIIVIIFGKYLSAILYETVVDGVLSFIDEILGVGLVPGGDFLDYFGSILMLRGEGKFVHDYGYLTATVGAFEASNFIVGSFIPGVDYATNIIPISPVPIAISTILAPLAPDSVWFTGTMPLSHKQYDKGKNMILAAKEVNVEKAKHTLEEAKHLIVKKRFTAALKRGREAAKIVKDNTNDYIDKTVIKLNNRLNNYLKDPNFSQFLAEEDINQEHIDQLFGDFRKKMEEAKEHIRFDRIREAIEKADEAIRMINPFIKRLETYPARVR